MTEPKPQYLIDAEAMEGTGYHDSPLEIHPPSTVIRRKGFEMYEEVRPAFVKISTGFKKEMADIDGNALKVWLYLALSINRNTEQAHPGIRTIAEGVKLDKDTVVRAVKRLEEMGLIAVNRDKQKYNIYEIPVYVSANSSVPIMGTVKQSVPIEQKSVPIEGESVPMIWGLNQINQSNQNSPEAGGNSRMKDRPPGGTDAIKKGDIVTGMLAFQSPPAGVDFSWLDEYLIPRAMAFWQETKITPMPDERSFWRKELRAQYEAGITVEQIKTACQRMRKDGLTIKSPASIRAVARDIPKQEDAERLPTFY